MRRRRGWKTRSNGNVTEIAVSDSSPLITLSRIGCLDLLAQLLKTVHISSEVYGEVVTAGAGRPGAESVALTSWIKVTPVQSAAELERTAGHTGLGLGEVSAIQLAREMGGSFDR
jgi:predicted nucleic acid-binding protein